MHGSQIELKNITCSYGISRKKNLIILHILRQHLKGGGKSNISQKVPILCSRNADRRGEGGQIPPKMC